MRQMWFAMLAAAAACGTGKEPAKSEPTKPVDRAATDPDPVNLVRTTFGGHGAYSDELDVPMASAHVIATEVVQVVDFDNDGTDEVVYKSSFDAPGYVKESLNVMRFTGDKLDNVFDRHIELDNRGDSSNVEVVVSCSARWAVSEPGADGKRALVLEPKTKPRNGESDVCVLAKESWVAGADGKLTKR